MFRNFFNVIKDEKLKIIYYPSKINIINYLDIDLLSTEKVIISTNHKKIVIEGVSLVVTKLMDKEVLISGDISKIEFR